MFNTPMESIHRRALALTSLSCVLVWSLVHARSTIEQRVAADPEGQVEIVNVAGRVELRGWDRPEVEVSGTAGDRIERVDVSGGGAHTTVHVVVRAGGSWGDGAEAHLVIHVPVKSTVSASLVSANLDVAGVLGKVQLQTVSGNVSGETGGDVKLNTVSGNVQLTARSATAIEINTISGDIELTAGSGAVELATVSGDAKLKLDTLTRGRFKSVSGDLSASLTLASDADLESHSVSGTIHFDFAQAPAGEFDVQSFTGDIDNCFGPKPTESQYGPGSRLEFKNGDGHAHVHIETKSGDVSLCAKGASARRATSMLPASRPLKRVVFPYVI